MERRTLLLELIAMLTLLSKTKANHIPIRNFECRWQACRDRLVCGFDQLEQGSRWIIIQSNLTLDDAATVRCQQAGYNGTQIRCLYEGLLQETKFNKIDNHKFKLQLVISQQVQIEEFNQTLAEMEVPPQWSADTKRNVTCPLPQRPPEFKGFYYDPKKEKLHIYWQPLDVWEFCSKEMRYKVDASSGHMVSEVGRDFAIFRGWNSKLPANLTIQSENSLGSSWSSSHLQVPILTNADQRQPRNVWYNDHIKSLRWDKPIEENNLVGYTIYLCRISTTNTSTCDEREPMVSDILGNYRSSFQFGKSMDQYRMAVVANYRDGITGGLVWSIPAPSEDRAHLVAIVGIAMLIFPILYTLCFRIYRKIRRMAEIKVELPYLESRKIIETSRHDHSVPLAGTIPPESFGRVLIKDGYVAKNHDQLEAYATPPSRPPPDLSAVPRSSPLVVSYTVMN